MKDLDIGEIIQEDRRLLWKCAAGAVILESVIITALGIDVHWLAHPQTTGLDPNKFVEAEVFQVPKVSHLTEVKSRKEPKVQEKVISHSADGGKKSAPQPESKNETDSGAKIAATHGPIAVVTPMPVIPSYLQESDLSTSVVIEFLVNNQGAATPRLVGSSGNEELDAIALTTVKQWQFKPAEQNHKPIDSKVRLKINFQVH